MRIAIMGAGAVGGCFGGWLSLSGQDVTFIARGDHLRAMQVGGLTLDTPKGHLQVKSARFVAEPAEVGACDVLLFASMCHGVAKGRPLELDSLSGAVVRLGRALGVPKPVHEMAYLALKPYKNGTPAPLVA